MPPVHLYLILQQASPLCATALLGMNTGDLRDSQDLRDLRDSQELRDLLVLRATKGTKGILDLPSLFREDGMDAVGSPSILFHLNVLVLWLQRSAAEPSALALVDIQKYSLVERELPSGHATKTDWYCKPHKTLTNAA